MYFVVRGLRVVLHKRQSALRWKLLRRAQNVCINYYYYLYRVKENNWKIVYGPTRFPGSALSFDCQLLYNISSIISSLLILYIVDKETGKYFLNQVWLSLAAVNKFNQEWNWIILDMKYTSVLGLLVTLKSLFFNGLIAVTGHLYFICA